METSLSIILVIATLLAGLLPALVLRACARPSVRPARLETARRAPADV